MLNSPTENSKDPIHYITNQEDDSIDLGELLSLLMDGKWLVILIAFAVLSMGIAKAFLDTPIYKVDVMLQINEKSKTMTGLEPLTDILGSKIPVMAEIELIKSRMVLGETIKNLNLDIIAKPKYFPFVGETFSFIQL